MAEKRTSKECFVLLQNQSLCNVCSLVCIAERVVCKCYFPMNYQIQQWYSPEKFFCTVISKNLINNSINVTCTNIEIENVSK